MLNSKTKQALVRQAMSRLGLDDAKIETLSKKPGVKTIAVENFLGTLEGMSERDAQMNLKMDAKSYKWNAATQKAIRDGIQLHFKRGHVSKQASQDIFFEIVDKRKWSAIRKVLEQAGDKQSVGLWSEASLKLSKALNLSTNEEYALNRMKNLMERPTTDPSGMRNQVFKIANELGIRLPSGMFASTKMIQASIRVKQRGGSWAAKSDKDFDININMSRFVLTAEHERGTYGHHTYRLILDGKPIGWLSKNSVMTPGSDGEMEHDYYEYTISDAKKRVLVDRAEGMVETAIEKALHKMDLVRG